MRRRPLIGQSWEIYKAADWLRTRVCVRQMCLGGAVGVRRWCGSRWVVFGCVGVRGGRVLGGSNFFWFLASGTCTGWRRAGLAGKEKKVRLN